MCTRVTRSGLMERQSVGLWGVEREYVIHMERRKFLLGVGGSAIGGGALLGSGAFTRIQSQRRVKIEVAEDPDAYLGLDGCPDSDNSSYTRLDESGHLEVEMSPDNPTEGGGQGINSDSFTWFDNVFQICNQGKQTVSVWIEAEPAAGLAAPPAEYADEDRVIFYNTSNEEERVDSPQNAFELEVGECKCIGIRTMTKGLDATDQLLEDDEIVIHADADLDVPPEELAGTLGESDFSEISFNKAYGQEALYGSSSRGLEQTPHEVKIHPAQSVAQQHHDFTPDGESTRTVPFVATYDDAGAGTATFDIDGVSLVDDDIAGNAVQPTGVDVAVTVRAGGDGGAGHAGDLSRVDNLMINGQPVSPGSVEATNGIAYIAVEGVDLDNNMVTIEGDWTFEVDEDQFDTSDYKDVPGLGIDLR
ncbi:DUF1102 domain-containing protein [Natrialbaceae archaeon A-CW3]